MRRKGKEICFCCLAVLLFVLFGVDQEEEEEKHLQEKCSARNLHVRVLSVVSSVWWVWLE